MALASVLVCLLAFEIGSRALGGPIHYHQADSLEFHPELGFRETPGWRRSATDGFRYRVGPAGFRGREPPERPEAGTEPGRRIAFVGDSFLVADAVRDRDLMTTVAERTLSAGGESVQVYNLSASDYGTVQELMLLRKLGRRIAPGYVVLVMYPANDLFDNSIALSRGSESSAADGLRPYLVENEAGELQLVHTQPVRAWARRYSRAFALAERGVLSLTRTSPVPPDGARRRLQAGRAPRGHLEIFERNPMNPAWEEAWSDTRRALRAVRDEARALGAKLLVLVVPNPLQVQRGAEAVRLDVAARLFAGEPLDSLLDWNLPERKLRSLLDEEGVDARFLLDPFRRATDDGEPLYAIDWHLAPRGHRIAAREVVSWIRGEPGNAGVRTQRAVATIPEPPDCEAWLDFGAAPHREQLLKGGWLEWGVFGRSERRGWKTAARPLAVLPARSGEFVVRGTPPGGLPLPIRIDVRFNWVEEHSFLLEGHGPFELRVPPRPRTDPNDYVIVELHRRGSTGEQTRNLLPWERSCLDASCVGLVLHAMGFEDRAAAAASAHSRARGADRGSHRPSSGD